MLRELSNATSSVKVLGDGGHKLTLKVDRFPPQKAKIGAAGGVKRPVVSKGITNAFRVGTKGKILPYGADYASVPF